MNVRGRPPRQNFARQNSGGEAVQDLINSFVRLSAAMSVYSLQQVQSAVGTVDPKESVTKLKKMIDSMTDALTAQIDDSKKATVDSISNLGSGVVERTFETVSNLNARDIVQTTNDVVRKTTDSLAGIMKSDKSDDKKSSASTPKAAGEVLATH
jgi:flagellin-specific chaperone FliS